MHPDSYHYLLKNSLALIGNSSSGIIEAPSLGYYTINIGDRQKGRIRSKSVLDVKCNEPEINKAIKKIITSEIFDEFENPYYKENSSLEAYKTTLKLLKKDFHDIKNFFDINYQL